MRLNQKKEEIMVSVQQEYKKIKFNKNVLITIIGESCTDVFVYGETKRLCPEGPVPILNPIMTKTTFGMASNVERNIASISNDILIKTIINKNQIKKVRYIDEKTNHMFLRVDYNDYCRRIKFNNNIEKDIKKSDIVIVSDYNKGFLSDDDLLKISSLSKISFIDSKRKLSKDIVDSFDFIKVNQQEFKKNEDVLDKNKTIITLGDEGSKYNNIIYPAINPQKTYDVSGAGDTFFASFILKYYETKNIPVSIEYANALSSIVVNNRGISVPFE